MSLNNDTTLLIKLPSDLKATFKALVQSKGLTVSDCLRAYMRDEVGKVANPPKTSNKPPVPPPNNPIVDDLLTLAQSKGMTVTEYMKVHVLDNPALSKPPRRSKPDTSERCPDTPDMFNTPVRPPIVKNRKKRPKKRK